MQIHPLRLTALLFVLSLFISCSGKFDGKNGTKTIYFKGTFTVHQSIDYQNGKRNGVFKQFFENGKLELVQHYANDVLIDSSVSYFEDGKLCEVQYYDKGIKTGCWRKYSAKGAMVSMICFKEDVMHGLVGKYGYTSGRPLQLLNYNMGKKEGEQREYYPVSGKPKCKLFYHEDRPVGNPIEWKESGKLIDNDFKFTISDKNTVILDNIYKVIVKIDQPKSSDIVYQYSPEDVDLKGYPISTLEKEGDNFVLRFNVYPGSHVMEKIRIGVHRKTAMGNTIVKSATFNAAANGF